MPTSTLSTSLSVSLSLCLFGLFPALKSISLNAFQQFAADTGSDDADSPQDIHFTTSMVALCLGLFKRVGYIGVLVSVGRVKKWINLLDS